MAVEQNTQTVGHVGIYTTAVGNGPEVTLYLRNRVVGLATGAEKARDQLPGVLAHYAHETQVSMNVLAGIQSAAAAVMGGPRQQPNTVPNHTLPDIVSMAQQETGVPLEATVLRLSQRGSQTIVDHTGLTREVITDEGTPDEKREVRGTVLRNGGVLDQADYGKTVAAYGDVFILTPNPITPTTLADVLAQQYVLSDDALVAHVQEATGQAGVIAVRVGHAPNLNVSDPIALTEAYANLGVNVTDVIRPYAAALAKVTAVDEAHVEEAQRHRIRSPTVMADSAAQRPLLAEAIQAAVDVEDHFIRQTLLPHLVDLYGATLDGHDFVQTLEGLQIFAGTDGEFDSRYGAAVQERVDHFARSLVLQSKITADGNPRPVTYQERRAMLQGILAAPVSVGYKIDVTESLEQLSVAPVAYAGNDAKALRTIYAAGIAARKAGDIAEARRQFGQLPRAYEVAKVLYQEGVLLELEGEDPKQTYEAGLEHAVAGTKEHGWLTGKLRGIAKAERAAAKKAYVAHNKALYDQGVALRQAGNHQDAWARLRSIDPDFEPSPKAPGKVFYQRGMALEGLGKLNAAGMAYQAGLGVAKEETKVHGWLTNAAARVERKRN